MGDDHGRAGVRGEVVAQDGAHRQAGRGVQRAQRLVQEQQARGGRQCAGQRHALRLTAGQGGRPAVGVRGHVDARQPGVRLGPRGRPAPAAGAQPERDVLPGAEVGEEPQVLEDDPGRALGRGDEHAVRRVVEDRAAEHDPAVVQRVQPGEDPQQRALAGAVGPTSATVPAAPTRSRTSRVKAGRRTTTCASIPVSTSPSVTARPTARAAPRAPRR